jgi:hypothetical protein
MSSLKEKPKKTKKKGKMQTGNTANNNTNQNGPSRRQAIHASTPIPLSSASLSKKKGSNQPV